MTTLIRLFVCDCCGTERRAGFAEMEPPERWHESFDFYGQIMHACPDSVCVDWLRQQCGYMPRKEGKG